MCELTPESDAAEHRSRNHEYAGEHAPDFLTTGPQPLSPTANESRKHDADGTRPENPRRHVSFHDGAEPATSELASGAGFEIDEFSKQDQSEPGDDEDAFEPDAVGSKKIPSDDNRNTKQRERRERSGNTEDDRDKSKYASDRDYIGPLGTNTGEIVDTEHCEERSVDK